MTHPYIPPPVNDFERRPISPLSDPHGSGLLGHSGAPLMNRPPRAPGARDMGIPSSGGGAGTSSIHGGGDWGSFSWDPEEVTEDLKARVQDSGDGEEPAEEEAPARPPVVSDADAPTQGIHDLGDGRLTHIRMSGPSAGGSAGRYGVATDLGPA